MLFNFSQSHRSKQATQKADFLVLFSNDFGVTVIRHQNTDAMVLACALVRGIHPLIIFKIADIQGGMPLKRALARTMASAFL
jgi:hypothetical protein